MDAFPSSDATKNFRCVILGIGTLLCSDGLINIRYIQNHWFFGLCPPSGILKPRECNVSETGSVSILRCVWETPTLLGPLERANLNLWATHVGI
jgi:hypothetical protein